MKKSVIGIGSALVDILTCIDDDAVLNALNLPKGSMQLVDNKLSERISKTLKKFKSSMAPGGSAANTIHGLAKMGISTGFIFSVGNDDMGKIFEDSMKSVGVEPVVFHSDAPSGTAHAIVSPDGERTFATNLGAAFEFSEKQLSPEIFKDCDYCYIEGYLIDNRTVFQKTMKLAKESNCKIVLDLASYNVVERNRDFLNELLPDIDIVFANEEEAKSLTNKTTEEALEFIASKCEIAVVKVGSKGSYIKRGDEVIKMGCHKVKVVDTTGAGDMYAAGFLTGLIKGFDLKKCSESGSLLAENVIQVIGAKMDEERWNEIKRQFAKI